MQKTERHLASIDRSLKVIANELIKMNGSTVKTKDDAAKVVQFKGDTPEG